jgi:DNA end-binding protein Ku
MPRSIWSGAISFGLVSVPVKLYSAVSPKTVRFHQLHASDGVRIQQKRVCPADGEEVAYEDIVKGYEIAPDRYVLVEPEELAALEPVRTRTIEIEDFVDLEEIDPIYYAHPYYLAPGAGGAKPYRLLLDAMRESRKVAIAKVVMRTKEQLVAIRPMGDVLAMATMNFADEVVDPERLDELPGDEVSTSQRELDIARQLVESLVAPFDPDRYRDTYREAVLELIERKAAGEEIAVQPAVETPPTQAPDLMSALQASLAEVRKRTGAAEGAPASGGNGGRTPRRRAATKTPDRKTAAGKSPGGKTAAGKTAAGKTPAGKTAAKPSAKTSTAAKAPASKPSAGGSRSKR